MGIAENIARNSPSAIALSLRAVWGSLNMPYAQSLEHGYALARMHYNYPDSKEGPLALAEGRAPNSNTD